MIKKPRVNRITATCVKGKYKGKDIEISIGDTHMDTYVYINGKRINEVVTGIWIKILPGHVTKLTMEFLKV